MYKKFSLNLTNLKNVDPAPNQRPKNLRKWDMDLQYCFLGWFGSTAAVPVYLADFATGV